MRPSASHMRPLRRRMHPFDRRMPPSANVCAPQSAICAPYASVCAPTSVCAPQPAMVVTRTFSNRQTDDRTMAAGASVNWTHCRVHFEVTWDKTRYVRANMTMRLRGRGQKKKKKDNFFSISNSQFSVFNPQNPQNPRAPRASRAKPQEEEGFFGLVPLVTHPSSIPLLGGLTPKFLSLSHHSL
jgi:hypothetical protein